MTESGAEYLFVIDTDLYAGNFEREMCAYLTGRVGDCGVGDEMADLFKQDFNDDTLFENVVNVPDDAGCHRPATIWPSDKYGSDFQGNNYLLANPDQAKLIASYIKYKESYSGEHIKQMEEVIKRLENGETVSNWTVAGAKKEIARLQEHVEKARKTQKIEIYPAHNSVGIWFDKEPAKQEIAIMKERALKFAEVKNKTRQSYETEMKLNIHGFRLIQFKTTKTETQIPV